MNRGASSNEVVEHLEKRLQPPILSKPSPT